MAANDLRGAVIAALVASALSPGVFAAVTTTGSRVVGQTLLAPATVSPRATFLRTDSTDSAALAAVPFELAPLGIVPGHVIVLSPPGDFSLGAVSSDRALSTVALFSSSAVLLSPTNLNRVPGALETEFVFPASSANTPSGLATDIPQDFIGINRVRVPAGATHLFFAALDVGLYGDNGDPDGDFGLEILRPEAIGASAAGTLLVDVVGGPTTFEARSLELGRDSGASGSATVDGQGALIEAGSVTVGGDGTGALTVRNAGRVVARFLSVARNVSTGTAVISGAGSEVLIENPDGADGTAERLTAGVRIGRFTGADGNVEVRGGGALRVDGKSEVFPGIVLGEQPGAAGRLLVTGTAGTTRSEVRITGATTSEPFMDVGRSGEGQLVVESEGQLDIVGLQAFMNVSRNQNSSEPVTPAVLDDGTGGCTGTCVQVLSGGQITLTGSGPAPGESFLAGMNIAREPGSDAIVRVSGAASKLTLSGAGSFIQVGLDGRAELRIQDGGVVDPVFTNVGQNAGSDGRLALSGSGSRLLLEGMDLESAQAAFLTVGRRGTGVATLASGAEIAIRGATDATSPGFQLGREDGGVGTMTLDGASRIEVVGDVEPDFFGRSGFIAVGRGGDGVLSVRGASTITNDPEGAVRVGGAVPEGHSPGRGTLTVIGSGSRVSAGRQLLVSADPVVNGTEVRYVSSGASGTVEVSSGGSVVAQAIQVGNGGSLRGRGGSYLGPVTAFGGGLVAPGTSPGTIGSMSIGGSLTLAGGVLEIDVAGPDRFDTLSVSGAATLAGTVQLRFSGGFGLSPQATLAFLSAASIDASGVNVVLEGAGTESAGVQIAVQGGSLVVQVTGLTVPPVLPTILQLLLED